MSMRKFEAEWRTAKAEGRLQPPAPSGAPLYVDLLDLVQTGTKAIFDAAAAKFGPHGRDLSSYDKWRLPQLEQGIAEMLHRRYEGKKL